MSNQHIVSITSVPMLSPKPKVFRLPPAQPVVVEKRASTRSDRKWRLGIVLVAFVLLWPALQKQANSYFSSHNKTKNAISPQAEELEGILQPTLGDAQAALPAEKPPTIMLRGQSEAIIGQMAKIPAGNEPIIETKPASAVDNHAARELLSIVSKY